MSDSDSQNHGQHGLERHQQLVLEVRAKELVLEVGSQH